ncbi:MAG: cytochrome P450 [Burkholderia sp.]
MFKRAADRAAGALNVTPLNAEQLEESRKSAIELETYFAKVLAERRKAPGDDLISQMILAEEDGQRLTDDEIVANLCFLFVAGYETTENMIGNTLIALQRHPEQRERVKADLSIMPKVG